MASNQTATGMRKVTVRSARVYTRKAAVQDAAVIPDRLAELTLFVLGMHAANGDFGWVTDMVAEFEAGNFEPTEALSAVEF